MNTKPHNRTIYGTRGWFRFRLRTLLGIMLLVALASSLWQPVIRPWLDSRQLEVEIAELIEALNQRRPHSIKEIPIRTYHGNDGAGMSAISNPRLNDHRPTTHDSQWPAARFPIAANRERRYNQVSIHRFQLPLAVTANVPTVGSSSQAP